MMAPAVLEKIQQKRQHLDKLKVRIPQDGNVLADVSLYIVRRFEDPLQKFPCFELSLGVEASHLAPTSDELVHKATILAESVTVRE